MNPYDVCIAYVSWEDGGKRRPVLVIAQGSEYTEAFRITSQYANKSDAIKARYFEISDWKQAGLAKPSYIDTVEPVELPTPLLSAPIGKMSDNDKRRLIEFLNN
uniref:Putative toxin-antitoxin system protein n=1 Tax=termite gut metagenome TaxID=433724 RepID=S0DDR0_9ZZZZ